jgi:4-amino-4-deoxychorismate lyase
VVALLGAGVVPADSPILRADDLGVVRGDGIFETLHVRDGQAWMLAEHLDRMARSATTLELELPDATVLADLVGQALAAWPPVGEAGLRIVCTRGPEDGGPPTVFATLFPLADSIPRARREGVAVATATLGLPVGLRPEAPWLLGGAKTVSYAVNMASLRWAKSVGAEDVLWVSSDGYALEAPTSTLVWLDGDTLCTVPATSTGILAGTTAAYLFAHAGELGLSTDERLVTPAGLGETRGAWFTSSVRGLAAIRSLDGATLPYSAELTERIRTLLGFPA